MADVLDYNNDVEPEVVESEEENEEANCKRWKSLPSLWQAAMCKESKKEQTKEEDEAPWAHEVKLRHVEDPECAQRGRSMLFFGPLPKSAHQSPTGGRRDTANSGSDSQFPDTQYNGTDVIYRPIRPRPSSVCDQVQIQTWDRRHLTSSSRTNANDVQQKCELQRNDSVSNLRKDALLLGDAVVQGDKPATDLTTEKKSATYKRPKPKKRWKLDVMEKGVQRSKSLNGIDRNDQPEWIELSRRLTSRNIDWDNLPIIKGGGAGINLQSELKLAWKIKGTQERAENYLREDGKEEIVLRKEDLAVITNGFTKPNKANRWEKLDSNANISQRQKSTPNPIQNSVECQRTRTLPQQPSAQEETVSWIKEAEKRRQKYMDWQSQETKKLSEETSIQKSPKVPKETVSHHVSTLPEIVSLPKNISTKLLTNQQLDPLPVTEEPVAESKKEDKIKDAVRKELSLFSVKLRRVRCAKPEECFHEVKCQPISDDNQPPPEPKAIVVPTITQPPVPSPRKKRPCKVDPENTPKDIEPKPIEDPDPIPRDTFSVQVSEHESDNFFIVINDQDDDSFLQIKLPQDIKCNKLASNVTATNTSSTLDQSGVNDISWSVTPANEQPETNNSSVTPSTSEHNEINISSITSSTNEQNKNISSITYLSNDRLDSNHVAIETPISNRQALTFGADRFIEMETMFHNLSCENQPESIVDIDLNANEPVKNSSVKDDDEVHELVNGDIMKSSSPFTNSINATSELDDTSMVNNNNECLYGKIHKIPNGMIPHQNNCLNLNGHRTATNHKQETAEEKAARMTSEICGVLSSLGNRKTEAEKLALHMDILTTLTCPNAVCPKNTSSRTMTFVTCNGDSATPSQVCGPHSVGVQTNGVEVRDHKKSQTRIKKKTVKIIIHECDDDDEKQEVVEEIVEEILEPRSQKGRMVKTPATISRTIAEAEDGSTYLTTTVTDNCVFRPEDAT